MKNVLFEIETRTTDNSLNYKLIYIVGRRLRGYADQKTYPKVTQCLLFKNNLLVSFGEVTKCDKDIDNLPFALKTVTKKVIKDVWFRQERINLWKLLDEKIKNLND